MRKKGFVFLETIVVLMVVTVSLSGLLVTYSLMSRKTKEKEYYDNTSDKYLLYSIINLGTNEKNSYANLNNVAIDENTCESFLTSEGDNQIKVFKSGSNECKKVFNDFGLKYLYVVDDINATLKGTKSYTLIPSSKSKTNPVEIFDNGTIIYMKSLAKCYDSNVFNKEVVDKDNKYYAVKDYYMYDKEEDVDISCSYAIKYVIGVFYRNGKYYYASIEMSSMEG